MITTNHSPQRLRSHRAGALDAEEDAVEKGNRAQRGDLHVGQLSGLIEDRPGDVIVRVDVKVVHDHQQPRRHVAVEEMQQPKPALMKTTAFASLKTAITRSMGSGAGEGSLMGRSVGPGHGKVEKSSPRPGMSSFTTLVYLPVTR